MFQCLWYLFIPSWLSTHQPKIKSYACLDVEWRIRLRTWLSTCHFPGTSRPTDGAIISTCFNVFNYFKFFCGGGLHILNILSQKKSYISMTPELHLTHSSKCTLEKLRFLWLSVRSDAVLTSRVSVREGVRALVEWGGCRHVDPRYLRRLSLQSSFCPFACLPRLAVIRCEGEKRAGFAHPPAVLGVPVKAPFPPDTSSSGSRTFGWTTRSRASWQLPTASTEATCVTSTWRPGRTASSPCKRLSPLIGRYCLALWLLWDCFKWLPV